MAQATRRVDAKLRLTRNVTVIVRSGQATEGALPVTRGVDMRPRLVP